MSYYSDPDPHSGNRQEREYYHYRNQQIAAAEDDQRRQREAATSRSQYSTASPSYGGGLSDGDLLHLAATVGAIAALGPLIIVPKWIGRTRGWELMMRIWRPISKGIFLLFALLCLAGIGLYFQAGGTAGALLIVGGIFMLFIGFALLQAFVVLVLIFPAVVVSAPFGAIWGACVGAALTYFVGEPHQLELWMTNSILLSTIVGGFSGGYFVFAQ